MSSAIPGDNHNLLLALLATVVWQLSFFAVAMWTLKPDTADEAEAARGAGHGVLLATIVAFFIA